MCVVLIKINALAQNNYRLYFAKKQVILLFCGKPLHN